MMKTLIKASFLAVLTIICLAGLALSQTTTAPQGKGQNICSNIDNISGKILEGMSSRETGLAQKKVERKNNVASRRLNRDDKLAEYRFAWDENMQKQYAKLEEKATTTEQKQAVLDFQAVVEAAVSARREDIDEAIADYRVSVDQVIVARKTAVDEAANTFKVSVESALQNAKQSCGSGATPSMVRQQLVTALKAAKDGLKSDIKSIDKMQDQLGSARKTRNEAVKKAVEDFKAVVLQAKEDLKAAFGETQ